MVLLKFLTTMYVGYITFDNFKFKCFVKLCRYLGTFYKLFNTYIATAVEWLEICVSMYELHVQFPKVSQWNFLC